MICCRCFHLKILTSLAIHIRILKSWMRMKYLELVCISLRLSLIFFYISFISLQICHYFLSRIKKNPFNLLFPLCTWILLPANNGMFYSLHHSNLIPKLFNWDFILYGDWTCQCHGLTWDVYCHEFFLLASNFTVSLNRCLIIWFWSCFQ